MARFDDRLVKRARPLDAELLDRRFRQLFPSWSLAPIVGTPGVSFHSWLFLFIRHRFFSRRPVSFHSAPFLFIPGDFVSGV
jgi:hypothetical protein